MDDLLKFLLIIVLFYFLLQIISKFCFPPNNKPSLVEGLCSAPDGTDTGISVEGDCTDPNIWSGCYDTDNNLTAAVSELNCGICTNTYTDGSSPPNQALCENGSNDQYSSMCRAPDGTTDENLISQAEAITQEDTCTNAGNIWGPAPGRWIPYQWRIGSSTQPQEPTSPDTSNPSESSTPASGGTCSDTSYENETDCIGNPDNPNGVCNNSGDTINNQEDCLNAFQDEGSCPSGGVTSDNRFSDTLNESDCSSAICLPGQTTCSEGESMEWTQPSIPAVWTVNTWTPNIDCIGSWSQCTVDCSDSTYTITTPQSGNGSSCEANTGDTRECNFGEGACVNPDTDLLTQSQSQGSDPQTYQPQTLSNMTFNVVIQPSQPTQPCQPDQVNCDASTSGPIRSCISNDDCNDQNTQCINNICVTNQSR